jgi:hypothetical protein
MRERERLGSVWMSTASFRAAPRLAGVVMGHEMLWTPNSGKNETTPLCCINFRLSFIIYCVESARDWQ